MCQGKIFPSLALFGVVVAVSSLIFAKPVIILSYNFAKLVTGSLLLLDNFPLGSSLAQPTEGKLKVPS